MLQYKNDFFSKLQYSFREHCEKLHKKRSEQLNVNRNKLFKSKQIKICRKDILQIHSKWSSIMVNGLTFSKCSILFVLSLLIFTSQLFHSLPVYIQC